MAKKRTSDEGEGPPKKRRCTTSSDEDVRLSQNPDFHCTQTMSSQREAGIIEEVILQNFMSHSKLHVKLGSHVNFLIGLNGSGKSTVLTAIIVGLGGRAAITNRGNCLKSLIKIGCRTASVTIKLRNCGKDAYKPDVYGNSIRVERTIKDQGANSYRLCGDDGLVKSKDRRELDAILDSFNILVDNPVVVLNQDTSKEFLLSKTPADLYRFFIRATQLEQMENDHKDAMMCKRQAEDDLQAKRDQLPLMEREVRTWEQKYNACSSLDKLQERIDRLKEEMAWAFVWEKERDLDKIKKELNEKEESLPKYVSAVEKCERKIADKEEQHKQVTEELKVTGSEASDLEQTLIEKKDVVNQKRRAAKIAADSLRERQNELRGITADRQEIVKRIHELRNCAPVDYAAQCGEREKKINELQQQLDDETAKLKTAEFSAEQFRSAVAACQEKISGMKAEDRSLNAKVDAANKKMRELESARGNELRRFSAWMPDLVKQINDAHRRGEFRERPRGPLGAHIKLRDQRWALAIEKCLGTGLMTAFAINDYRDEKVFEKIASRICGQQSPTTIVSRFQHTRHSVPKNPFQVEFPTVLEMLDIQDPVVANCLIDQRRVEYVLLAEKGGSATDLMQSGRSGSFNELFTINGDQLFSQPCYRNYASGGGTARYLTANLEQLIRGCESERRQWTDAQLKKREEISQAELEMRRNTQEQKSAAAQQQKFRSRITDLKLQLNELRNSEIAAPVDVQALEDEEKFVGSKIAELQQGSQELSQASDEANRCLKEAEADLKSIENRIRSAAQKLNPFRDRLAEIGNEIDRGKQDLKHYRQKLKEYEKTLAEVVKKRDAVKREVEEMTVKAKKIREEPVRTRRTPQNLESEIVQIQKQITHEQKSRGDPEEIRRIYLEKKKQYQSVKDESDSLLLFTEKLSKMLKNRDVCYAKMRDSLSIVLGMCFVRNLGVRNNFSGNLRVDHKERVIDMIVSPRNDLKGADVSSNRSLSGGERTFATTCFILSLWDNMEVPFRCLDEFDVFMDLVNRRLCMDMMIRAAAMKPGCQFVFLSPLNMSQLNLDVGAVDVKIFEMAAPRD